MRDDQKEAIGLGIVATFKAANEGRLHLAGWDKKAQEARAARRLEADRKREARALQFKMSWGVDGEYRVWDDDEWLASFKDMDHAMSYLDEQRGIALDIIEAQLREYEEVLVESSAGYGVGPEDYDGE